MATLCWPGQAGGRAGSHASRAVELSVPVLLPGLQPWPGRGAGVVERVRKGLLWGCGCCRVRGNLPLVPRLGDEGSQTPPSSLSPQGAI